MMQRIDATEQERIKTPDVWLGHKRCRPAKTRENTSWSVEEITAGSYVCFQPDESSEYFEKAGFEVGKVLRVPTELTSDHAEVYVEYHQFDE